jgi:hypothetical protein
MRPTWLILLPLALAIAALTTASLLAKLGVALSCAGIFLWLLLRHGPEMIPALGWLIAAFVLSAGGDWFLSHRSGREAFFVAGIGLFFGAHAGFLRFAWCRGRLQAAVLGACLALYVPYYLVWLRPAASSRLLAISVLAYLLISCLVFSVAAGLKRPPAVKWPFVAGIGLILFSDTIISFKEFVGWSAANWLILPTYYLAHLCIAWSALVESTSSGAPPQACTA